MQAFQEKKLSQFFNHNEVSKIMKSYSKECTNFFKHAKPRGLRKFLQYIKIKNNNIKIYILSGGEKNEIEFFLIKNKLSDYFDEILSAEKSKNEHLQEKLVTRNDLFIGDSKNDLNTSLQVGVRFILMNEFKSLASFPEESLIKKNVFLNTKNFESLIYQIS